MSGGGNGIAGGLVRREAMATGSTEPVSPSGRMAGRRVIITGAASGIGLAVAELLTAEGARTVLIDRSRSELEAVGARTGGIPVVHDLLDVTPLPSIVARAADDLGGLDGLINCAGVEAAELITEVDQSSWNRTLGVNLVAPFFLCQAAVPYLVRVENASIVNVASGAALLPTGPTSTVYAASKGGLLSFTKALAMELAPKVRVNAVCPGIPDTPMVRHLLGDHSSPDDAPAVARYALGRAGRPAEIAAAILFLASVQSSFVTGSTLAVDGGRVFH